MKQSNNQTIKQSNFNNQILTETTIQMETKIIQLSTVNSQQSKKLEQNEKINANLPRHNKKNITKCTTISLQSPIQTTVQVETGNKLEQKKSLLRALNNSLTKLDIEKRFKQH